VQQVVGNLSNPCGGGSAWDFKHHASDKTEMDKKRKNDCLITGRAGRPKKAADEVGKDIGLRQKVRIQCCKAVNIMKTPPRIGSVAEARGLPARRFVCEGKKGGGPERD